MKGNLAGLCRSTHGLLPVLTLGILCFAGCRSPEPEGGGWVYFPSALSGTDGEIKALATHDSVLYAGGDFRIAGKVEARNIARWDGHAWSALGEGLEHPVDKLAVGGNGVIYAHNLAARQANMRWDGREWKPIPDVLDVHISSMVVDAKGDLLVSGDISITDSGEVDNSARWNGTAWKPLKAWGPLFLNPQGEVFTYRKDYRSEAFQMFRFEGDTTWVRFGIPLDINAESKIHLFHFDAAGNAVVVFDATGEGAEIQVARMGTEEWTRTSLGDSLSPIFCALPDVKHPDRLWIFGSHSMFRVEGNSVTKFGSEHSGWLLAQMKNGQIITSGGWNLNKQGTRVHIARLSGDEFVGLDSTGADMIALPDSSLGDARELSRRIPEEGRPSSVSSGTIIDVVEDGRGGLYVALNARFEKDGMYFNHLMGWKDNAYTPLGGGLSAAVAFAGIQLARSPDGTLYAANSSLKHVDEYTQPSLHLWDGKAWHFVRTAPPVIDMVFDGRGNLYALATTSNGSSPSLCRIPLAPSDSIEYLPGRFNGRPKRLTADDSLIHVYGDFLRVDTAFSFHHAGWRTSMGPKNEARRSPVRATSTDRIRILAEGPENVGLLDTPWVEQSAAYSLYNTEAKPFDSVYLRMPRIDSLELASYSERGEHYTLASGDYAVSPQPEGYLVRIRLRDPVGTGNQSPLYVRTIRKRPITRIAEGYLFQDTLRPLAANLYAYGNVGANTMRIRVADRFPIQGKRHPKDTMVVGANFPHPFSWVVKPDPDRLADPFFKNPDHQTAWYSHLLKCIDRDTVLMGENPLPDGLTPERVYQDLWKDPVLPSKSEIEIGCNLYAKQWKSQKDPAFLVFFETSFYTLDAGSGIRSEPRKLRIGLYHREPDGGFKLAATADPREFEPHEQVASLDFAPYRLNEKEFAFGVRMRRHFVYGGGGGSNETLTLYRVAGGFIEVILRTLMSSNSMIAGEWNEDGTRDHEDHEGGTAIIAVTKKKTRGFFDWRKEGDDGKSAVFKWDGRSYELAGEDPVNSVNVD